MKRFKKLISMAMIVFLIIIANINFSYATQENNIKLKINCEEKQYKQGDIISLEVKIDSLPEIQEGMYKNINVIGFDFIYDKDILEINKIYDEDDQEEYDDMDAVRGWEYTLDYETNCILLTNFNMYSTLDETILKINLKVKKDFKTVDIKFENIEASGGVGEENNFKSEKELIFNVQGSISDSLYLSTAKYKIGENDEDTSNYQDGDKYLTKISPNTTISEFIANLSTNGNISIYNADGEEEINLDELVKTGMTIKVTKEGSANIILTIIVTGDVNEDGIVDITDLVKIRQQIQRLFEVDEKVTKFNGIQDKAGDINEDLLIDITDLVKIRRYIQKMENL